jgi:hypothetical protein
MFQPKSDAVSLGYDSMLIPCRNGLDFGENQQVVWDIPRNVGMAQLKDARVLVDVNINGSDNAGVFQLDRIAGGNSLFDRITIRSSGRVIEQLDSYNVYAKLHYSATDDDGVMNKRSVLEGCAPSYRINDNPFISQAQPSVRGHPNATKSTYVDRRLEIPLLGGVFTNPKAFPLMAVPLEVECILATGSNILHVADGGENLACEDIAGIQSWVELTANASRMLGQQGNLDGTQQANNSDGVSTASQLAATANLPFRVGQLVRIAASGGGAGVTDGTIASVEWTTAGAVRINFTGNISGGADTGITIHSLLLDGGLLTGQSVNYQFKNPRLIIPKVVPDPKYRARMVKALLSGKYQIPLISYIDYNNAIVGSQTSSTNIIPADLSRVKSILSVPIKQEAHNKYNNHNALSGAYMGASEYEYQINNILRPDRRVDLTREANGGSVDNALWGVSSAVPSWSLGSCPSGFHLFETEKALRTAGINVRNLQFLTKDAKQDGYWLVGRTLGPYGTSENLMGISSILYLNYSGSDTALKLLHNYVVHVRTLGLSMNGVEVRY